MALDDFYNDLFNGESDYWDRSHLSGSVNWVYTSSSDSDGTTYTEYKSGSLSLTNYIPQTTLNIQRVLDRVKLEELVAVERQDFEKAADLRDKALRITENKSILIKLYDLKERSVTQGDYAFAIDIKEKIQNIITGNKRK